MHPNSVRRLTALTVLGLLALPMKASFAMLVPPCDGNTPPDKFVFSFFQRLESAKERREFAEIYESLLTAKFRAQTPFNEFMDGSLKIREQLGIQGVQFNSRVASPPQPVFGSSNYGRNPPPPTNVPSPGKPPSPNVPPPANKPPVGNTPQSGSDRPSITFVAVTSSKIGKVDQRLVLECERGGWKASGFWYSPARF